MARSIKHPVALRSIASALPVEVMLTITVCFSARAGEVDERVIQMGAGATVRDAVVASALRVRHPGHDFDALATGVWGVRCDPERVLRDRDRVELYRALAVDPKEARRLRYRATRPSAADSRRGRSATGELTEPIG